MIENNIENNLPDSIEDIDNKNDLIRYYKLHYEDESKEGFINLIIHKLEDLPEYNSQSNPEKVGLNLSQKNNIIRIINSNNTIDIKFNKCINELSFYQINYIGW
jgi:hypothetical protein